MLVAGDLAARSLAVVARDGDGYVAMASFCAQVPPHQAEAPLRLKLLLDCSGSMGGDSIAAAKRALHEILSRLQPQDRFSLSRFGSHVVHVTPLLAADAGGVRAAAKALRRWTPTSAAPRWSGAARGLRAGRPRPAPTCW